MSDSIESRFERAQMDLAVLLSGKPESALRAQKAASLRKFYTPAAVKIRRGRPIRVR